MFLKFKLRFLLLLLCCFNRDSNAFSRGALERIKTSGIGKILTGKARIPAWTTAAAAFSLPFVISLLQSLSSKIRRLQQKTRDEVLRPFVDLRKNVQGILDKGVSVDMHHETYKAIQELNQNLLGVIDPLGFSFSSFDAQEQERENFFNAVQGVLSIDAGVYDFLIKENDANKKLLDEVFGFSKTLTDFFKVNNIKGAEGFLKRGKWRMLVDTVKSIPAAIKSKKYSASKNAFIGAYFGSIFLLTNVLMDSVNKKILSPEYIAKNPALFKRIAKNPEAFTAHALQGAKNRTNLLTFILYAIGLTKYFDMISHEVEKFIRNVRGGRPFDHYIGATPRIFSV